VFARSAALPFRSDFRREAHAQQEQGLRLDQVLRKDHQAGICHLQQAASRPLRGRQSRVFSPTGEARWTLDTEEEFFAEYRLDDTGTASYEVFCRAADSVVDFLDLNYWHTLNRKTSVRVRLPTRSDVESVFEVFEDSGEVGNVKPPPRPAAEQPDEVPITVFVGHGKSEAWRDLADHLRNMHGLKVESFESKPRAGMSNLEVVLLMADIADFAVLVHTPEDEAADGTMRARQNVVHETGLFQAQLGPRRAVIVRQEACEDFSNIDGIQEVRFSSQIREVFGELVAVMKREYPDLRVLGGARSRRRFVESVTH
jgi:hypothetical protein